LYRDDRPTCVAPQHLCFGVENNAVPIPVLYHTTVFRPAPTATSPGEPLQTSKANATDINPVGLQLANVVSQSFDILKVLQIISLLIDVIRDFLKTATNSNPNSRQSPPSSPETTSDETTEQPTRDDISVARSWLKHLESNQISLLRLLDQKYSPLPELASINCVTWIVLDKISTAVLAPFATCVDKMTHIMMFNILQSQNLQEKLLKVVVGNYLCEFPFHFEVPQNLECAVAVVVVVPQVQNQQVTGVQVMLFMHHVLALSYQKSG